jgi:hypothetical protein
LTRGATKDHIDLAIANTRSISDFCGCQIDNAATQNRRMGKVKLMGGAMNRIDIDGR